LKTITENLPDPNLPSLVYAGQSIIGGLEVQFNSMEAGTNAIAAMPESAQSYGTLAAWLSNNWLVESNGGAAYGGDVENPIPCTNDADYLSELNEVIYPLTATNSLRLQYIEVFPANVIDYPIRFSLATRTIGVSGSPDGLKMSYALTRFYD
jgi:hypothetical protein